MSTTKLEPADGGGVLGVVAILGGTFDPIHNAHLQLADAAWRSCPLSELRWIPAGLPPHRAPPLATPADRLAMVRLAVGGRSNESVDAAEIASPSPSYTVVTLERLRRELGTSRPFGLLLGADALRSLPTWHRWEEIFSLTHLIVTERPGNPLQPSELPGALHQPWRQRRVAEAAALERAPAGKIYVFPMPPSPLSATAVRTRLKVGEPVSALLPAPVLDYIRQHSLYR
jgi:nicotinate-nucleotide adenylyltransferase